MKIAMCIVLVLSILVGIGFIAILARDYKKTRKYDDFKSSVNMFFIIYWVCAIVFFIYSIFKIT